MFSRILVVTDGSDHATRAVKSAATLAAKFEANLTIGHVLLHGEPPSAFRRMADVEHLVGNPSMPEPGSTSATSGLIAQISKAEQNRISQKVMEELGASITKHAAKISSELGAKKVGIEIEEGDTANRILKIADKVDADLIVLGTRGFGPIKALLLGSTSQKVTQVANCACLTVK